MSDQRERQLSAEPIDAADPMESTERNEPADPIDRIEPAEPMERIDLFDAIDRIEPSDHNDQRDRVTRPWSAGRQAFAPTVV